MTKDLIAQYQALAAGGKDLRGLTVLRYADEIGALLAEYEAQNVLDYGCGAGDAYRPPHSLHERWGIPRPVPFDPAFPKYARSVAGQVFDAVLCIDVLEHLANEDEATCVIDALFDHADHFIYASVCCRPAAKQFPDGTNLHTLVRPLQWWQEKFAVAGIFSRIGGRRREGPVNWILRETP